MKTGTLIRVTFVVGRSEDWREGRIVEATDIGIVIKNDITHLESLIMSPSIVIIDEIADPSNEDQN